MELRLPSTRLTPLQVILTITQHLAPKCSVSHYVVADSAFGGINTVKSISTSHFGTASISANSPNSGVQQLLSFVSSNLKIGESRTFKSGTTILQVTQRDDRIMGVITNDFILHTNRLSSSSSSRKKKHLTEDILKYHPYAQSPHPPHCLQAHDMPSYKNSLLEDITQKDTITKYYSSTYGMVDRTNKYYYSIVKPAYHRSWEKLFFFSLLMEGVTNSWALYEKWCLHHQYIQTNHPPTRTKRKKRALYSFIANIVQQISQ